MPEILSIPLVTKADIVEEIWAEVSRRHTGSVAKRQAAEATQLATAAMPPGVPTALSLPELLALDGEAFAQAAYYTIMRRPADEAGAELLLQALAAGESKIVLLGRLCRSAEGRAAGQTLPGLSRRFLIHRLYRMPAVGPGLRLGAAILRRLGISRLLAGRTALPPVSQVQMQAYVASVAAAADSRRDMMERRLSEQQMAIDLVSRRFSLLQSAFEEANRKSIDAARALNRQMGADGRRLISLEEKLAGSAHDVSQRLKRLEAAVSAEGLNERVADAVAETRRALVAGMQSAAAEASCASLAVAEQDRRLAAIIETLRSEPALGRLAATIAQPKDHTLDPLYVAFEDVFRGTRADIKQRQRFYLPTLADVNAGTPARPILDIGCGRGEFLELLKEEGLTARGVDANVTMASLCQDMGLDAVVDDAVSYLSRQESGSLGAVTGFHIVEHLPFATMVRLFDEALRALAPGGAMIFETPNPANVIVGSYTFYTDPTHIRPLPGQMMVMIATARGFDPAAVVELHPMDKRFKGGDPVLREELDALFHGPQDYALIARKP